MTDSVSVIEKMRSLSAALREFHKELLQETASQAGFSGSPLQLYELATKGDDFAWLRPLSKLIADIDARTADGAPIDAAELAAFKDRIEAFIDTPSGETRNRMNAAVQSRPAIGAALGGVRRAYNALK